MPFDENKNKIFILETWDLMYPRRAMLFKAINTLVIFGAVVSSFWAIYLFTHHLGFGGFIGGFVAASIVFRFGPAPLFAAAASVIAFKYHQIGVWFPILSYIFAAISLVISLALERVVRLSEDDEEY